ncbi:MAG: hypothetical protein AB7S38_25260 [Vulcanimicrobiota bacterium]
MKISNPSCYAPPAYANYYPSLSGASAALPKQPGAGPTVRDLEASVATFVSKLDGGQDTTGLHPFCDNVGAASAKVCSETMARVSHSLQDCFESQNTVGGHKLLSASDIGDTLRRHADNFDKTSQQASAEYAALRPRVRNFWWTVFGASALATAAGLSMMVPGPTSVQPAAAMLLGCGGMMTAIYTSMKLMDSEFLNDDLNRLSDRADSYKSEAEAARHCAQVADAWSGFLANKP